MDRSGYVCRHIGSTCYRTEGNMYKDVYSISKMLLSSEAARRDKRIVQRSGIRKTTNDTRWALCTNLGTAFYK